MTTHTAAQREKRRADAADAMRQALNIPLPFGTDNANTSASAFWRQAMAANAEFARFGVERAQAYHKMFTALRGCQSPADAARVVTEAGQATMQAYMSEMTRMGDMGRAFARGDDDAKG